MESTGVERYVPFIDFLIDVNYDIFNSPICGDLLAIFILMEGTIPEIHFTWTKFVEYVVDFDKTFPNIIELQSEDGCGHPKIVWLYLFSLQQLRDRLRGTSFEMVPFRQTTPKPKKNETASLIALLKGPLYTKIPDFIVSDSKIVTSLHSDYNTLESILKLPTAKMTLDKQKTKQLTEAKPFLEVCKDYNHGRSLSNFCLNNRENSYGTTDKISGDSLHSVLESYRNLIPPDLFKCAQSKIHFLPIINNQTEVNLGDCSYLDACHKMKTCRYLHYFSLYPNKLPPQKSLEKNGIGCEYTSGETFTENSRQILPPQWINCDVRYIPFSILGKFAAIVSDPAWDIHMSLPYGTCKDTELLSLPMTELQDEGIIMLWVTGRSIEVGRQALIKWGYKICDEMIWIKLNQLKRTIVTGRTGHWLNHSKEHLLVGLKGNPVWLTRKVDLDIVVSNTRQTSRKPDEIYDIVERMVGKYARKLEVFGRDHNTRKGWLTIGNQLKGTHLVEDELKMKYEKYISELDNKKP